MSARDILVLTIATGLTAVGPVAAQTPTFAKDVAPILYKSCVSCHRPGEIGPMSLITYNDARPWARAIRERVQARDMPPWHADSQYLKFRNDRSLSDKEVDTLVQWANNGAPQGTAADMPKLPD